MEKVKISNFTVDRCGACRAIWLDANELQRLLEYHREEADELDRKGLEGRVRNVKASADTKCPRDGSRLIDVVDLKQTHVLMLSCKVCGGVLLDAGELTDLTHYSVMERLRGFFSR